MTTRVIAILGAEVPGLRRSPIKLGTTLGAQPKDSGVLASDGCFEILSTAIQSNAVVMTGVVNVTREKGEQRSVQVHARTMPLYPGGSIGVSIDRVQGPPPLIHPFGISSVDKSVGSNAAISGAERYMDGGIIGTHRQVSSSDSAGVVPPAATNGAGVSCVNFTTSRRRFAGIGPRREG